MVLTLDVPEWDDDAPAILPEKLGEMHAWESGSGQQQQRTKKGAKREKMKKEKEAAVIQSMLFGTSNEQDVEERNSGKIQKPRKKEKLEGKGVTTAQQKKQSPELQPKQTKIDQKQNTNENNKKQGGKLNEEQESRNAKGKKDTKNSKESVKETQTQEERGVKRLSISEEQETKGEDEAKKPPAKKSKTEQTTQKNKVQKQAEIVASESSKQQPSTKTKNEPQTAKKDQMVRDSSKSTEKEVQKNPPTTAAQTPQAINTGKKSKKEKLAAMIEDRKKTRAEMETATNKPKDVAVAEGSAAPRQQQPKSKSQTPAKQGKEPAEGGTQGGSAARKLEGSRFRWVNEQLYTSDSNEAVRLMEETPELFHAYHKGFRSQVDGWSENPVDVIIRWLSTLPQAHVVGDFGCGEAKIAATARQTVHSFDLVAANETVVACDIAHVPLKAATLDVAIYCLALMGTNFVDFLLEAHRLLKPKGTLKIAEVRSRIPEPKLFVGLLKSLGFDHVHTDTGNSYFLLMEFTRHPNRKPQPERIQDPTSILKPCIYKRR